MYFLSEASRGAKNQRPCKRKALRTHIPAQSFRRSSRELAHSARIVCLSARICRTDLAPKAETAETIEYFNIDEPKKCAGESPVWVGGSETL